MIENKLPKSWSWQPIIELLTNNSNGKPFQQGWSPQCENHPADENTWGVLKTTAIQDGQFLDFENKKLPETIQPRPHLEVMAGDILMTCAGPRNRCGVVCFVKSTRPKLLMSGKMYRFRPNSSLLDTKFLEAFIRSHEAQLAIDSMKTGISDSGLNLTHGRFSELKIPLAPLNEQKRIVARIEELFSELDNGIAALKTAREQLKVYRQAILKHAFEGKLTAKWRGENAEKLETPEQLLARIQQERNTRYQQQLEKWKEAIKEWEAKGNEGKKPSKPKKSAQIKNVVDADCVDYPMLPAGWSYVRLGMLMDEPAYGTSAKCEYESGEQGVLRIPNIINGAINDSDLKFASFEKGEVDHLRLEEGDILIIRSNGSISLVGSCALIHKKDTQHIFAGYLIRLRSNPNLVLPSFLLSVMSSHLLRKQIEAAAKSTSGVNNINSGELQNLIIPLPSVDEQHKLLIHMEALTPSVNATEEELVNQLKKAETLRQSILKKAFSGKLVPQDLNDEPASKLLERIRTEKAAQAIRTTNKKWQIENSCYD